MIEYIIMMRFLGGEWQRYQVDGKDYSTNDLAQALGQKATILDPIREAMVIEIASEVYMVNGTLVRHKKFDLVE